MVNKKLTSSLKWRDAIEDVMMKKNLKNNQLSVVKQVFVYLS